MRSLIDPTVRQRSRGGRTAIAGRARSLVAVGAVALLLGIIAIFAAGCGNSSPKSAVASIATPRQTSKSGNVAAGQPSGGGKANLLKFSACMRAHGIPKFPDPNAKGDLTVNFGAGTGIDLNSAIYKSAQKACGSLGGSLFGGAPPKPNAKATLIKFGSCMRKNGVPNFPEPSGNGGFVIPQGSSGFDPNSPQFRRAAQKCNKILRGAGVAP